MLKGRGVLTTPPALPRQLSPLVLDETMAGRAARLDDIGEPGDALLDRERGIGVANGCPYPTGMHGEHRNRPVSDMVATKLRVSELSAALLAR